MDDAARELLRRPAAARRGHGAVAGRPVPRRRRAQAQFDLLFDRLAERVHGCADGAGRAGRRRRSTAGREAWETLQRLPREVEALNLDRADAFFTALGELRQAAQA